MAKDLSEEIYNILKRDIISSSDLRLFMTLLLTAAIVGVIVFLVVQVHRFESQSQPVKTVSPISSTTLVEVTLTPYDARLFSNRELYFTDENDNILNATLKIGKASTIVIQATPGSSIILHTDDRSEKIVIE